MVNQMTQFLRAALHLMSLLLTQDDVNWGNPADI